MLVYVYCLAWGLLGTFYMNNSKTEKAADALLKAMELENTAPVVPFSSVVIKL